MSELWKRIITATSFAAIGLVAIFFNQFTYLLLAFLLHLLSLQEFFNIAGAKISYPGRKRFVAQFATLSVGTVTFLLFAAVAMELLSTTFLMLVPVAFFLLMLVELYLKSAEPMANIAWHFLGLIYVSLPLGLLHFVVMHDGEYHSWMLLFILLLIWANDIFAYFTGRLFGNSKLFPRISPKKTWEGFMGGAVATLLVGLLLGLLSNVLEPFDWLMISIIVVIFGTLGDLVESMLKRSMNIKDSGTILPGHGGLLDRFDSFYFVIPFIAAYLYLK